MKNLRAATRANVWNSLSYRPKPKPSFLQQPSSAQQLQQRQFSLSACLQAQPIDLSSNDATTSSNSPIEASSLSQHVLSRASTDADSDIILSSQQRENIATRPITTTLPIAPSTTNETSRPPIFVATVTRTGTMTSTVQLTAKIQNFDRHLQKSYTRPSRLLAHNPHPEGFLREGDTVEYSLFNEVEAAAKEEKRVTLENRLIAKGVIRLKTRKGKERSLREVGVQRKGPRWVVRRVITPFGEGIEERTMKLTGAGAGAGAHNDMKAKLTV